MLASSTPFRRTHLHVWYGTCMVWYMYGTFIIKNIRAQTDATTSCK